MMNTMNDFNSQFESECNECRYLEKQNAELKKHIAHLEETALKRSVEFEQLKKLADQSVKELDKIMKMVEK